MIIADENLHQHFIDQLVAAGFELVSIRDELGGISDHEVAAFAKYKQGLLITEDKDFGELVYAHNLRGISIIFVRYDKSDLYEVTERLMRVATDYYEKTENYFITITANKIRINLL